ncbi:MAG TPA: indole-3-glycerol phosphate synthase TrpC [Bryobacteraceae bacterium]|nr:indole-3-glycerol phosphate synthase TrpC [Bryobacteraceae bacterium]
MTSAVPDILARIVQQKARELESAVATRDQLEREAESRLSQRRNFAEALRAKAPAIIGEIKQASPSKGVLVENFDPVWTARCYEKGGASALSVLTDRNFFCGSLDDLQAARGAVSLSVLRKDFTTSDYHVLEAAAHGADAILLIAAILEVGALRRMRELGERFSMTALVEVHDQDELAKALDSGASVIGVNNRDLRTFTTSLEVSLRLADHIPSSAIRVSESGIETAEDVRTLSAAGYQAFLVGERLMRAENPAEALAALRS